MPHGQKIEIATDVAKKLFILIGRLHAAGYVHGDPRIEMRSKLAET